MELDGAKIQRLRLARFMTVRELAAAAQMSYTNVSRLEHDRQRARARTVRELAKALNVEPAELLKTPEAAAP